ncbi:MAG: TIGR03862 family flavoprotein, partial [Alsobacter sp.]
MTSSPLVSRPRVAIVGAGPAGLAAAEVLAVQADVTLYDRMPAPARKFLLAGRGGLNLTHSEPLPGFMARYGATEAALAPAIAAFSPEAMRDWADALGQHTFVGSSGRVFPRAMKASPLLRAWLRRLDGLGVSFVPRHRLAGFGPAGALKFETPEGLQTVIPDATLLALGGGSWPRLGSDGGWTTMIAAEGVPVAPLQPANCGFEIAWSEHLRTRFAGTPLKSAVFSVGPLQIRGEAIVTAEGLEGGAIYALSGPLRDAITREGFATLVIDLKPDLSLAQIAERLAVPRPGQSTANILRKALNLSPLAAALIREPAPLPASATKLAARIKALRLRLDAPRPIERAISTAGGIRFDGLDSHFMLAAR